METLPIVSAPRYTRTMLNLSDILLKAGLDPKSVMVMRHRPTERALRAALPWLAAEQPDVYNAYQQVQGETVEKSLANATHLVSLIGNAAGLGLFVGVFAVNGCAEMPTTTWQAMPSSKTLLALGDRGPMRESFKHLDLALTEHAADWRGRLVLRWPPPERSWWRWAARNEFMVEAIHAESQFVRSMPEWHDMVLTHAELRVLPASWRARLSQWRGVYIILDRATGKPYVGSAYGKENILARWDAYASTGHGGNADLKDRDASEFQFAILERVSPDMDPEDVIRREASWKARLGSREFGLNKN